MIESVLFVFLGLTLLVTGGELLVRSASKIANTLGISPLVIGLTIVAYGTSAPELGVSLFAAIQGSPEIALANVVGSNIFNIGLILGLCSLIAPLTVHLQLIKFEVPIMILVSVLSYLFCLDGKLGRTEGVSLFLGAVFYTSWLVRASKKESAKNRNKIVSAVADRKVEGLFKDSSFILLALVVLIAGSKLLVNGAVDLAKLLGVSDSLIGLTIVAAGTSLPEVATSVMATVRGKTDIAIGNVIGSNIFNILFILGLSSSINSGLKVDPSIIQFDLLFMVGLAVICLPFLMTAKRLVWWEGTVLLGGYFAYIVFLVYRG
ncbi:MAG: calcium/sodium antiporter [Bdellovibrionales bacterium]|nr:calcium/sodium antiporter [Bdellovibrionales bacterium]